MFLRTRTFVYAAALLVAASGLSGCIIDECGGYDDDGYWETSTCDYSSQDDDCWSYELDMDLCGDDSFEISVDSQPSPPAEADCDPMIAAYDECVADFGECFEPCASFLTEHSLCVHQIDQAAECAQIEAGYADCVETFGAEFEACAAFAQELESTCSTVVDPGSGSCGAPEDTDSGCEPCAPCDPEEADACPDLQLAYEQCTLDHCAAHELCVGIAFELELNHC